MNKYKNADQIPRLNSWQARRTSVVIWHSGVSKKTNTRSTKDEADRFQATIAAFRQWSNEAGQLLLFYPHRVAHRE